MISLDLSDEQLLLEASVRQWAAREVAPHIRECDRQHRFDPRVLPQMADLGLLGVCVPAEYGGAGMDYIALGLASEELEYVDTSLRVILSVHVGLNSLTLLAWGTEDQKQRYLVPQAQGKKIATFGLTEPAAGSDVRGIQTVAIQQGDRYVSPARRCGSRSPTSPTTSSSSRGRTSKRRRRATPPVSALSSSSAACRGSRAARSRRSGASSPGNTGSSRWTTSRCRPRTWSGRQGEGFKIAMFALDQGRYTVAAGRDRVSSARAATRARIRPRAQDVRCRDRRAPAREGNDRADGVRLPGRRACSGCVPGG